MLTRFTTPRLGLILPAYNEQEVLPTTLSKLNTIKATLIQKNLISDDSFIMVVDDGSVDNTWEIIQEKEQIIASNRDSQIFFDAITKSKKPNEALTNALNDYDIFISKTK